MIICYDKKTVKGSGRNDIILYITYSIISFLPEPFTVFLSYHMII